MKPGWKTAGGVLLALAAVGIITVALWHFGKKVSGGESLASWAQAVGSIAAIVGALWIFMKQEVATARRAIKEEVQQGLIRAYGLHAMASEVTSLFIRLRALATDESGATPSLQHVDGIVVGDLLSRLASASHVETDPGRAALIFETREIVVRAYSWFTSHSSPCRRLDSMQVDLVFQWSDRADAILEMAKSQLTKAIAIAERPIY